MRFFYGNELEPRAHTLKFSTNHHESWKMLICLQHLPTILPKLPAPTRLRRVNYCCRGNGTDLHQLPSTGTSQCQSCGSRLRLTSESHSWRVGGARLCPRTPLPLMDHTQCPGCLRALRWSSYLFTCTWHIRHSGAFPPAPRGSSNRRTRARDLAFHLVSLKTSICTQWTHQ